jgi:hypothetical protein
MSSSVGVSKRPGTAYAAAAAAKQRRQRVIAAALGVLLIAILVYEVPKMLKLFRGSKSPAVAAAPAPTPTAAAPNSAKLLKALLRNAASDPFAQPSSSGGDPTAGEVAIPPGSVDPFAAQASSGSSTQTPAVPSSPLPEQIIIGKPGAGRVPSHGWIVILASIPTGEGITAANSFASKARSRGLSPVSVLNSSNRRPLRGGYWVVYTGPYATLNAVSSRAGSVHSLGYPTAYIRELIVYR